MENKSIELLEEIKKIFSRRGVRNVSMDDICQQLGISKKTLYKYFNNKNHLLECLLENHFEKWKVLDEQIRNLKLNAIDTILEVSKVLGNRLKEMNPVISFELKKYYPAIYEKHVERTHVYTYNYVKENLEQGIRDGLYREDLDTDLIASLYIRQIEDIFDQDLYCPKQYTFSRIFEVVFEKYIRGIANTRGIKYFEEKKPFYQY